ncbi:MAG: triose-phosphate isomerase [Deltaproteobacteria bacterium]|nr:MAG: triose-phosphate isomerase [Deltaproteobacteria bacterium]
MPTKRTPIIVGNWKLNKTLDEAVELATAIRNALGGLKDLQVGIAPTFPVLSAVAERVSDSAMILAGQNCCEEDWGAYTGEVSVPALKDVGCNAVIVGHSERRQLYGETDHGVNAKVKKVLANEMMPIICIGETLAEREAERTFEVVERQLEGALEGLGADIATQIVIAYEPVWAIGTGLTATTAQAQEVHGFLRGKLEKLWGEAGQQVRIQYGGSVKPNNISGLMAQPDVDGALVGGAALSAESFIAILNYDRDV